MTGATVAIRNRDGASAFLIVCEHAANAVPVEFDDLGLDEAARSSHIAWDPGALAVAVRLAEILDAPLVESLVSRLLYDCNRPPHEASAVPAQSEVYRVPGNEGLSQIQRRERVERFYLPFRGELAALIEERSRAALPLLVTVHSFTPVYFGRPREVEIGMLHDADSRLADAVLAVAGQHSGFDVRRNEPYGPEDGVTHTLREHALPHGLLNVMIEVRNDLIATPADQDAMAGRLASWLTAAVGIQRASSTGETPSWAGR